MLPDSFDLTPPAPESLVSPPLIRRTVQLSVPINIDVFNDKVVPWLSVVAAEGQFPTQTVHQHWQFWIDVQEGMPKPKGRLIQIPHIEDASGLSIEIAPPQQDHPAIFTISQFHNPTHITRFEALLSSTKKWFTRFAEEFNISEVSGIIINYANELTYDKYPELWHTRETAHIGNIFRVIELIPKMNSQFALPFNMQFTQAASEPLKGNATVHLRAESRLINKVQNVVVLANFGYESFAGNSRVPLDKIWEQLQHAHRVIYGGFSAHFTHEALNRFARP